MKNSPSPWRVCLLALIALVSFTSDEGTRSRHRGPSSRSRTRSMRSLEHTLLVGGPGLAYSDEGSGPRSSCLMDAFHATWRLDPRTLRQYSGTPRPARTRRHPGRPRKYRLPNDVSGEGIMDALGIPRRNAWVPTRRCDTPDPQKDSPDRFDGPSSPTRGLFRPMASSPRSSTERVCIRSRARLPLRVSQTRGPARGSASPCIGGGLPTNRAGLHRAHTSSKAPGAAAPLFRLELDPSQPGRSTRWTDAEVRPSHADFWGKGHELGPESPSASRATYRES